MAKRNTILNKSNNVYPYSTQGYNYIEIKQLFLCHIIHTISPIRRVCYSMKKFNLFIHFTVYA